MEKNTLIQIGQVAKRTGLSVHAIRFYEEQGLLDPPARRAGGFRLYPLEAVERLLFIQKAQGLGLTLKEIKSINACGTRGLGPCCDLTVDLFNKKIHEFDEKTKEMNRMKKKLRTVLSKWAGKAKK